MSPLREASIGLLLGAMAAALAAVPGALRSDVSVALAWLSLWGSAALLLAPAVAALRVARPLPPLAWAVPLGVLLAAPVLIVFARVLKTATHHRPLGAATFAVVAAIVLLGAIAVCARLVASRDGRIGKIGLGLVVLFGGAGTLLLALPLVSAAMGSAIDGVLVLGLGIGAALWRAPESLTRLAKLAGPAVFVLAVGAGFAVRSAEVRSATAAGAPLLAGPFR